MRENGGMTTRGRGRPRGVTAEDVRSVALDLFTAHGYDNVTLTRIAREAGISRTTLFMMYPTKRDIVWVDHEIRRGRLHDVLTDAADGVIETLERALCTIAHYRIDEHAVLAQRHSLVYGSAELEAYSSLKSAEVADEIAAWVGAHTAGVDGVRVERVVRALMTVSSDIVREWAQSPPEQDLEPYLRERLAPFVRALAPLLSARSL